MAALAAALFVTSVTLFGFRQTKTPSAPCLARKRLSHVLISPSGLASSAGASLTRGPEETPLYTRNSALGLAAAQHRAEVFLSLEAERAGLTSVNVRFEARS